MGCYISLLNGVVVGVRVALERSGRAKSIGNAEKCEGKTDQAGTLARVARNTPKGGARKKTAR